MRAYLLIYGTKLLSLVTPGAIAIIGLLLLVATALVHFHGQETGQETMTGEDRIWWASVVAGHLCLVGMLWVSYEIHSVFLKPAHLTSMDLPLVWLGFALGAVWLVPWRLGASVLCGLSFLWVCFAGKSPATLKQALAPSEIVQVAPKRTLRLKLRVLRNLISPFVISSRLMTMGRLSALPSLIWISDLKFEAVGCGQVKERSIGSCN
ncbi:MAG: hypothetical protein Q8Q18_00915 [bacterium]|nr:hypothetical protein [bacterium]